MANKKIVIFVIVFLAVFLVLLTQEQVLKNCQNFFYNISEPIQASFWNSGQGFSLFLKNLFSINQLINENQKLVEENRLLAQTVSNLAEIQEENQTLRQAINAGLNKKFDLGFAHVLSKAPNKDYLLVDIGAKEGIKKGLPVITSDKILIGRVEEVFDDFSKITLHTAKDFSFDTEIQGKNILSLSRGEGNLKSILDYIPKDKDVLVNDLVITSNLGGKFPEGLIVGKVKSVEFFPTQTYQNIEVEPLFSFENLDYVFIIKNFPVDVF